MTRSKTKNNEHLRSIPYKGSRVRLSFSGASFLFLGWLIIIQRRQNHVNSTSSLLLAHANKEQSARRLPTSTGTATVSGHSFFDSKGDGTRDVNTSSGISDTFVSLFTCSNDIVDTAKTDAKGFYAFEKLHAGQYYVNAMPPMYYALSDVWTGKTDGNGDLLYPAADSTTNPDTGRTPCFDLGEGETKVVSFAMKLKFSSNPGSTSPALENSPMASEATGSPTALHSKMPSMQLPSALLNSYSMLPSKVPTTHVAISSPSRKPSLDVVPSGLRPVAMPSVAPSRSRDFVVPATSEQLVMNIRGIGRLEDEEAWSLATSNYILSYFSWNDHKTKDAVYGDCMSCSEVAADEFSIQILAKYTGIYVAMTPFSTQLSSEWYMEALQSASPYYDDVTSIDLARADPPQMPTDEVSESGGDTPGSEDTDNKEKDHTQNYITYAGQAFLVVLFILPAVIFLWINKKEHGKVWLEPEDWVDNNSEHGLPIDEQHPTETISLSDKTDTHLVGSCLHPPPQSNSFSRHRTSRESLSQHIDVDSVTNVPNVTSLDLIIVKKHVIAPCGNIGIVTETPNAGGPAYVCEIEEKSPVIDRIRLDDEIIAVDDEDVREMSGTDLSRLVQSGSTRGARKITILRGVVSRERTEGQRATQGDPPETHDDHATGLRPSTGGSIDVSIETPPREDAAFNFLVDYYRALQKHPPDGFQMCS